MILPLAIILAAPPVEHRGHLTLVTLRHAVAVVNSSTYAPTIEQGRAWRVVDSSGAQVGAIIEPEDCAIRSDAFTWLGGQLDCNADGFVNAADFDLFAEWFRAGAVFADFDCDGFVTGDDHDSFTAAFAAGVGP